MIVSFLLNLSFALVFKGKWWLSLNLSQNQRDKDENSNYKCQLTREKRKRKKRNCSYLSYISWKMSLKRPSYFFRIVFLVLRYKGQLLDRAIWKELCANSSIDLSWLYIPMATPPPSAVGSGWDDTDERKKEKSKWSTVVTSLKTPDIKTLNSQLPCLSPGLRKVPAGLPTWIFQEFLRRSQF